MFSIQIFHRSAAFDCRDILDTEKGMHEVYQLLNQFDIIQFHASPYKATLLLPHFHLPARLKINLLINNWVQFVCLPIHYGTGPLHEPSMH